MLTDKTNAGFARDIQLELERMKFVYENGVYRLRPKKSVVVVVELQNFTSKKKALALIKKLDKSTEVSICVLGADNEYFFSCRHLILVREGKADGVAEGCVLPGLAVYSFVLKGGIRIPDYSDKLLEYIDCQAYYCIEKLKDGIKHIFYSQEEAEKFASELAEASCILDRESGAFNMITVDKFASPFTVSAMSREIMRYVGAAEIAVDDGVSTFVTADAAEKCLYFVADEAVAAAQIMRYSEVINGKKARIF